MTTPEFDYALIAAEERPFARRLAVWIVNRLPIPALSRDPRVLDLGAGHGVYVEEIQAQGWTCAGVDICEPQSRPDLVRTQSLLDCDISSPVVMCIEVLEHIPAAQAEAAVQAIWRCTEPGGWVIFSAAQPGQGGVGHINCQPWQYWRDLAQVQGFQPLPDLEQDLHRWITQGYHMGWFAQNRQIWQRPHEL